MGGRYDDSVILTWKETFRAGPATCGGKGPNLARLHRHGFPVPRGGVLPDDVCSKFILPFIVERVTDFDAVRDALRRIPPDSTLAVRSSAAAAKARPGHACNRLPEVTYTKLEFQWRVSMGSRSGYRTPHWLSVGDVPFEGCALARNRSRFQPLRLRSVPPRPPTAGLSP
jgi:hypothetical protein